MKVGDLAVTASGARPDPLARPSRDRQPPPSASARGVANPDRLACLRRQSPRARPLRLSRPCDLRRHPRRKADTRHRASQREDGASGRGRRGYLLARRARQPRRHSCREPALRKLPRHGQPSASSPKVALSISTQNLTSTRLRARTPTSAGLSTMGVRWSRR